jgi:hypothetical protein
LLHSACGSVARPAGPNPDDDTGDVSADASGEGTFDSGSGPDAGSSPPVSRVTDGLQLLYAFAEQTGTVVRDVSGVGAPVDLDIASPGSVIWDGDGLVVAGPTIIRSAAAPTKLIDACVAADAVSIEAWVRTADLGQSGPARIASLSVDLDNRDFTLGQLQSSYTLAVRATNTDLDGDPSLATSAGAVKPTLQHVVWTWRAGVINAFLDGVPSGQASLGTASLDPWDPGHRFALANEHTLDRPWVGEYRLVAVYCRALSAADVAQNFAAGP